MKNKIDQNAPKLCPRCGGYLRSLGQIFLYGKLNGELFKCEVCGRLVQHAKLDAILVWENQN